MKVLTRLAAGMVVRIRRDPLLPPIGRRLHRWAERRGWSLRVVVERERFTIWVEKHKEGG